MPDLGMLQKRLAGARVDTAVFGLRPDYRVVLLAVDGLVTPSAAWSSASLARSLGPGLPLGGEDLACYTGAPRLVRATGQEPFDTVADGATVIEYPAPGEVVWRDDAGVTCRRWNWRQARRTQLTDDTTAGLFILDALDAITDEALHAAADELAAHLTRLGPDVGVVRRLIAADTSPDEDAS